MVRRLFLPIAVLMVSVWVASASMEDPRIQRAREALAPFKKQLREALVEALPRGSAAAIEVCKKKAPQIAAAFSVNGIELGRTTTKPRNPMNAPADWMKPLLAELERLPRSEGTYLTRILFDGRLAYAEPIYMQGMCSACHGDPASLDEEARALLRKEYPRDKATGYREGDFRGMFWVTVR